MNNGKGKLVPSRLKDVISLGLGKNEVISWTESDDGLKLWRFAPEGKGIEYSVLNKAVSDNGLMARSFLPSSGQDLFMEKPEGFQESLIYDSTF